MMTDRSRSTSAATTTSTRSSATTRVFFFQAADGIRDHCVTGVQTCALPISRTRSTTAPGNRFEQYTEEGDDEIKKLGRARRGVGARARGGEIGRASCRERVEIAVVAV